jgi:hypothetical protein
LVDDGSNGVYFRLALRGETGPEIVLDPGRLERVELPKAYIATDLEGIDVLADGRVVVLSERLRALERVREERFGRSGCAPPS